MSMRIDKLSSNQVETILKSSKVSNDVKQEVVKNNLPDVQHAIRTRMNKGEYTALMKNRSLVRFKPVKNSFTKKGDKILLAKALGIQESQIQSYIDGIIETNFDTHNKITKDNIEIVKAYIYRHGKKDEVIDFLKYELSTPATTLKNLYRTLDDDLEGLSGYYNRPIHRMTDTQLRRIYETVDSALSNAQASGSITQRQYEESAKWSLEKIYEIQNNSKLIREAKALKTLS